LSRRPFFPLVEAFQHSRARIVFFVVLCLASLAAVPARSHFEQPAWDVAIYLQAVDSLRHGHDPYADAIARQEAFHLATQRGETGPTPFSYVYGPITLPALWFVAAVPLWLSATLYWSLYAFGMLAQLWVGFRLASEAERPVFLFFLPVAAFFPGLLASDIVWSGNIAFILYGAILAASLHGWTKHRWLWFYVVTVVACCFKAPLLTLLAIPVFTARKQWLPAALAAASGLLLFFSQSVFAPSLFRHYLQAVELQFSYNRDFGSSPAGLFSGFLFDQKLSYSPAAYILYVAYATPLCLILFWLSRRFLAGRLTLSQWVPTLLIGVVLLNPRILEYDEILLTLPMALVTWRFFRALCPHRTAVLLSIATFAAVNVIAYRSWSIWKLTEGPLIVCCFLAGAWTLRRYAMTATYSRYNATPLSAATERLSHP
jgi:hypothetical protein